MLTHINDKNPLKNYLFYLFSLFSQVKTSHNVCKSTKTPVLGFSETAEKVFEHGPQPLRRFSGAAK